MIAFITLIFAISIIAALIFIKNKKTFVVCLSAITIFATGCICVIHPNSHKQFSISIIDYIFKFNTDGSITTTKQTTTTFIQEGTK